MTKKIRVFLTVALFVLISNLSYGQQALPIFDDAEESPCHWTAELLRTYAYYAVISAQYRTSLYSIQSAPNDPYYNDLWWPDVIRAEDAWNI